MISLTVVRVVFVPGFMQRGEAWAAVAKRLPERYSSLLLDHAEHDLEGRLGEIEAAAGRGAALVGYSLGGRLALRAALRAPERYGALVTVGASAGLEDGAERAARRHADERLADWIEAAPIEEVVAVWERQPLFADQSDALVEAQRPGRLSHEPRQLARVLRSAGQGALEPVWRCLGDLRAPLLALAGAHDEFYARAARRLGEAAPHGHAALVPDAGHAPQLQRPAEVAELVAGFLDEHLA